MAVTCGGQCRQWVRFTAAWPFCKCGSLCQRRPHPPVGAVLSDQVCSRGGCTMLRVRGRCALSLIIGCGAVAATVSSGGADAPAAHAPRWRPARHASTCSGRCTISTGKEAACVNRTQQVPVNTSGRHNKKNPKKQRGVHRGSRQAHHTQEVSNKVGEESIKTGKQQSKASSICAVAGKNVSVAAAVVGCWKRSSAGA